jgi:hypothetical protein
MGEGRKGEGRREEGKGEGLHGFKGGREGF